MSKSTKNTLSLVSFYEIERQACGELSLVINACTGTLVHSFAQWLRDLARAGAAAARRMAAEGHRRAAVHTLQQLDDRTLADIGVPRSEIDIAMRSGRLVRATFRQPQDWNGVSERREAA